MKNAIDVDIRGLKCDNPKCDYTDMSIKVEDYEKYVNTKCPKCGEILLTEDDYRNTKFLLEIVKVANKIFPKREDDSKDVVMNVEMNGTGSMDFNIKEGEK